MLFTRDDICKNLKRLARNKNFRGKAMLIFALKMQIILCSLKKLGAYYAHFAKWAKLTHFGTYFMSRVGEKWAYSILQRRPK
jgi:hypothetical protein